jgi:hypothetical protein
LKLPQNIILLISQEVCKAFETLIYGNVRSFVHT